MVTFYAVGSEVDDNGVRTPIRRRDRIRARLSSFYFADPVGKPSRTERSAALSHTTDDDEKVPIERTPDER